MAWAYLDTSALIKRYVEEAGRREVLTILRRHDCVVSAVLPIEIRSALRRRAAEGTLAERDLSAISKRLTIDRAFWTVIEVSREALGVAELLAATHPLRALDAIHLGSAQLFAARVPRLSFLFVSADLRQTATATAIGLRTQAIEL